MLFLFDLIAVIGGWTFLIGCLWLACWFIFVLRDDRPKEGIRCRSCFYNLHMHTSDQCPECGADLKETGVWADRQPRRGRILAAMAITAWASVLTVVLSQRWLDRLLAQWGVSFDVAMYVPVAILLCTPIIPIALGIYLRQCRNKKGIRQWQPDHDYNKTE